MELYMERRKDQQNLRTAKLTTCICLGIILSCYIGVQYYPDHDYQACQQKYITTNCTIVLQDVMDEFGIQMMSEKHLFNMSYQFIKYQGIIYPTNNQTYTYVMCDRGDTVCRDHKISTEPREIICYWDVVNTPKINNPCTHFLYLPLVLVSIICIFFTSWKWEKYRHRFE